MLTRDEDHIYRKDGKIYISVTQHLEIAGWVDFSGVPPAVLEAKRVIGEYVDKAIELLVQDDLDMDSMDESYLGYVEAFQAWLGMRQVWDVKPMARDNEWRVAGELDLIVDGVTVDVKTTAAESFAHIYQVGGYDWLRKAKTHGLVLYLRPNGEYRVRQSVSTHRHGFTYMVQQNLAALYNGIIPVGAKNNPKLHDMCKRIIKGE